MSEAATERLRAQLGDHLFEVTNFRGDDMVVVAPKSWREVARFLKDDEQLKMNLFVDLTAVDYPQRAAEAPRFDVVLIVRSLVHKHRVQVKTRVGEDEPLDSLCSVWSGANWAEREVYDMFGISFRGHPDLRRILMYEEFVGYPLRKDYPIEKAQPLVPYRDVEGINKLPPFGVEEGQPWGRIDWQSRLEGRAHQVSPAIAVQTGQRRTLSDSDAYNDARRGTAPKTGSQTEGTSQADGASQPPPNPPSE